MRELLDTNVVLDAMLKRVPWHLEADAILIAAAQGQVTCATTPLSLATVFYVGRKLVGTPAARAAIRIYMKAFEILSIDCQTVFDADAFPGNDFEDNLLIASAVRTSLDAIVTRNSADFSHSPIPVWQPAELVRHLGTGASPTTGAKPSTGSP